MWSDLNHVTFGFKMSEPILKAPPTIPTPGTKCPMPWRMVPVTERAEATGSLHSLDLTLSRDSLQYAAVFLIFSILHLFSNGAIVTKALIK